MRIRLQKAVTIARFRFVMLAAAALAIRFLCRYGVKVWYMSYFHEPHSFSSITNDSST